MEIKHTFEILAKDIQDIEKLVRNIQNSPKPAGIDFDLALAKIRNVYEVLLMVREDYVVSEPSGTAEQENKAEAEEKPEEDTHYDTTPEEVETKNFREETHRHETVEPEPDRGTGETIQAENEKHEEEIEIKEDLPEKNEPVQVKSEKQKKEAEILAEKFNKESSINENLGLKRSGDMTSRLASQPIESISRNIGINDRFYIIKELFNGDSEGFNLVISNLDQSNNFNDAFHILEDRFPDTLEHEGVQILVNLVRRRFITSGNV